MLQYVTNATLKTITRHEDIILWMGILQILYEKIVIQHRRCTSCLLLHTM